MDSEKFENYLKKAQELSQNLPEGENELLEHIEFYRKQSLGDLPYEEFFKGEQAFYSCQYERSLTHYMKAISIPRFQFFCYRASAYISKEAKNLERAFSFARKAQSIDPKDPAILKILDSSAREKQIEELVQIFEPSKQPNGGLFAEEYKDLKGQSIALAKPEENVPAAVAIHSYLQEDPFNHPATSMENTMNTEAEFFSAPRTSEGSAAETLTHRLYSTQGKDTDIAQITPLVPKESTAAFEELRRLANSDYKVEMPATSKFMSNSLGIDPYTSQALEHRIQTFQKAQSDLMQEYSDLFRKRSKIPDNAFYVLQGWDFTHAGPFQNRNLFPSTTRHLLTEHSRSTSGGFFLRWNGKGIVINPGRHFIDHFHQQGLHIKDIDFVIVTKDDREAYSDVEEIYELNYQLNKVNPELQIIHYYLNQKAYEDLSRILKPNFKQARHAVHNLEIYLDSPDVEKVELSDAIQLHYFLASTQDAFMKGLGAKEDRYQKGASTSTLGIRLDLKIPAKPSTPYTAEKTASLRIGYISGVAWSPLLAHNLGNCDLLIAGFGNTSPNDYDKLSYNPDSLGYHGTFSLLEEVNPRLLLCSEFGGREGDIRIEVVKKIRQEYAQSNRSVRNAPVVLPGDIGLLIDLKTLQIQCSVSQILVDPNQAHVVKFAEAFGNLRYLSPACCI